MCYTLTLFFFFQAEDGIRDYRVTGVQTCALPIFLVAQAGRLCHEPEAPTVSLSGPGRHQTPSAPGDGAVPDRKSVVEGKSGDLGGRRILKKKKIETEILAQEIKELIQNTAARAKM